MSDEHTTPAGNSRPPRQKRTGLTSTGVRKAASKSARTRSREFALQGLYQHLVGKNSPASIDMFTRDLAGFLSVMLRTTTHCCTAASPPRTI